MKITSNGAIDNRNLINGGARITDKIERPVAVPLTGLKGMPSTEVIVSQINPYENYNRLGAEIKAQTAPPEMDLETAKELISEIRAAEAQADYTGMSDGEIYTAIRNRYVEAFGEDFDEGAYLGGRDQSRALNEARHACGLAMDWKFRDVSRFHEAYREANGYAGETTEEIKQEIMSKYGDPTTYRDYLHMMQELEFTGAIDGNFAFKHTSQFITMHTEYGVPGRYADPWNFYAKLDTPITHQEIINRFAYVCNYNEPGTPLHRSTEYIFREIFNIDPNQYIQCG